jgi:hypothetical protein
MVTPGTAAAESKRATAIINQGQRPMNRASAAENLLSLPHLPHLIYFYIGAVWLSNWGLSSPAYI